MGGPLDSIGNTFNNFRANLAGLASGDYSVANLSDKDELTKTRAASTGGAGSHAPSVFGNGFPSAQASSHVAATNAD